LPSAPICDLQVASLGGHFYFAKEGTLSLRFNRYLPAGVFRPVSSGGIFRPPGGLKAQVRLRLQEHYARPYENSATGETLSRRQIAMLRVPLFWKVLLGLTFAGVLACVVAWYVLLFNICSNPREAVAVTQNTIPYSCHGMTVFITPLQEDVLVWDGPVGFGLIVLMIVVFFAGIIRGQRIDRR